MCTDRRTDRTTTVTLAAHARRGLMKGTKVQTLGARAVAGAWCMAGCLGHNYYGHGLIDGLGLETQTVLTS